MKRKKSYLLFLLGEFTITSEVLSDLVNTLTFVIGSPYLKYVHHDNLIITHFESYDTLEDIDFYLGNHFSQNELDELDSRNQSSMPMDRLYASIEQFKAIVTSKKPKFIAIG